MLQPRLLFPRALAIAIVCAPLPAHAGTKGWSDASDVARDALVAAALLTPTVQGDWDGAAQAGGSVAVAGGTAWAMKQAFPEWRPDRSNRKSFPSGHTAVAFASAATLENRYGWKAGLPAHVAAIFVGAARVEADRHHWYDVMAGALVGEVAGLVITRKHDESVQFLPWGDSKGAGVTMATRF